MPSAGNSALAGWPSSKRRLPTSTSRVSAMAGGPLPGDLRGWLVRPQALEAGVAELAVLGPLGEGDLGHQLGADPVDAPHPLGVLEGRAALLQGVEAPAQVGEDGAGEPGADLARVAQASPFVVADEEGAQAGAAAAGLGEPADHQLLAGRALHLEPVGRAAGGVGGVGPLGDDPLPSLAAGMLQVGLAVPVAVGGEPEPAVAPEGDGGPEQGLAGSQRQTGGVLALQVEEVEEVEVDRHRTPAGC